MKKILLVLVGISISIICLEFVLQIIKPPMLFDVVVKHEDWDLDIKDSFTYKFFKYLYVDIYDNYYKLDNKIYRVNRVSPFTPDAPKKKFFNREKAKDTKRIFIIGESVAEFYPKENLEDNLKQFVPNQKFEVINAGTGSYESLRVGKILKEIINYKPDYVIVLVGNNDGTFDPIEINYFPYKYKLFRKSYILNRLSNYFVKREHYNFDNIEPFFEKNIVDMVQNTKDICPMFFVTLPHNLQWSLSCFFDSFPLIDESEDVYREKIYIERRNFLKQLTKKYNWVRVIDFDKELKKYIYPDYKVFMDKDHYHFAFYDLISRLFVETILKKPTNINKEYINDIVNFSLNDMENWLDRGDNRYNRKVKIIREIYFYDSSKLKNILLKKYIEENSYINIIASIHVLILYDNDKNLLFEYLKEIDKAGIKTKEYCLLKSLAYIKYKDINKAKQYFDLAKSIDENNEIQISFENLKGVFKE